MINYFSSTNFTYLRVNVHFVNDNILQRRYNQFSCFIYIHCILRYRSYKKSFATLFLDLVDCICIRLIYVHISYIHFNWFILWSIKVKATKYCNVVFLHIYSYFNNGWNLLGVHSRFLLLSVQLILYPIQPVCYNYRISFVFSTTEMPFGWVIYQAKRVPNLDALPTECEKNAMM